MRKIEDVIKRLNMTKQDAPVVYPAKLGDGTGKVIAGTGLVYIRINDVVSTAVCSNSPLVNDLDVWVGYDPLQPNILRVLGQRNLVSNRDYTPDVAAHAAMHELMGDGPLGGTDVVKVRLQQFMPLAVWPYDNNMKVVIYPGVVWLNDQYQLIADINPYGKPVPKVIDFGEYPSPDDGKEMYYLIGIDINGDIKVIGGNQVDEGTLTLAHIPEPQPSDHVAYCLAAVRRSRNMSIVLNRETADIVDLRFPLRHTHTPDEVGGHDPVTVTDSETVDFTLSGQQLTASVIPSGIRLDALGAPLDITDLNATTNAHGLLPKLTGTTTVFLRGDGQWAVPPAGQGGGISVEEVDGSPSVTNVTLIKVSNGTLTDEGNGVVRIATGGGSGSSGTDILAVQVFS